MGKIRDRRDLTGMQFGRWAVLRQNPERRHSHIYYDCRCECGQERTVGAMHLRSGKSTSCGCLLPEVRGDRARTHGMTDTPTYQSWCNMKLRCDNPIAVGYENYGGRGISYCARWNSFEAFLEDMGPMPAGLSLDRIDPDGNYGPDNCRWASPKTQQNNKRNNRRITYAGQTLTVAQWAERLGVDYSALKYRLNTWDDLDRIMTEPYRRRA